MSLLTDSTARSGPLDTSPAAVPGLRARPERLVLGVRDGVAASAKPPVRIFLGTEPDQYRAERIFVWSIEQVRDPSRVYEIHLMKDLAGFRRLGWLTGFTNYRFAIPHFCDGGGRAIYNDVDQIYLADPAELFDTGMNGHGVLAVAPGKRLDTSVMLIDCARMASVWPIKDAQVRRKNALIARARAVSGLIGELAPEWNARDEEYVAERSKLLHYTALHMQPWQPFPKRFVYQRNPVGRVWFDLKQSADAAGYQIHGFDRPSPFYADLVERMRSLHRRPGADRPPVSGMPLPQAENDRLGALISACGVETVLRYGLGTVPDGEPANGGIDAPAGCTVHTYDPGSPAARERPTERFDAVVCADGLGYLPKADASWVVEELFRAARRLVYAVVREDTPLPGSADDVRVPGRRHGLRWWFALFEGCGIRYPDVHWRLVVVPPDRAGREQACAREGGRGLGDAPKVWVLCDGKPGHATQSVGLAEALGWPYEIKNLRFNALAGFGNLLTGPLGATRVGVDLARSDPVEPPWPDVVIATGWRPAPLTRWIGRRSRGRTRTVQLGRKGGRIAELFDVVISCAYFRLPPHPRRIETAAPLNRLSPQRLSEEVERWPNLFGDAPSPRVVLVVGGSSRRHILEPGLARRLGEDVRASADAAGGTVFAITSRRTGAAASEALRAGLGEGASIDAWQENRSDNPYLAYLALADAIVVTGDSESMAAEAVASGKPVYIYPIPERRYGLWSHVEEWVAGQAFSHRRNRRGTVRPQRGLQRLCARIIAHGLVQPRRDLTLLHEKLYELGLAKPFGEPLVRSRNAPLWEAGDVAQKVGRALGYTDV